MDIALAAVGFLLPKLSDLLVAEFTLKKRVRRGIESLVTELTMMHAVLRKMATVPPEKIDEGVKIWAGKVKELSYRMEDIVDTFMVRMSGQPGVHTNMVNKLLKKTLKLFKKQKDLHQIFDDLDEAVGQARQLGELRQRYNQDFRDAGDGVSADAVGVSVDPRVIALHTAVTELIGIEETRDNLISMLFEGDDCSKSSLKTVSIVGAGGLGKTTLAKAAFDMIKGQFDCHAFVPVSQNPNMKKVFMDILYGLDKIKYADIHNAKIDENQLIDIVDDFLTRRRYLIVIDDIWDAKVWQFIRCAFSKRSLGSRIITTTRVVSVSEACCSSSDDIYKMKPLSDDVSRKLFNKRVFSHENGCPDELMQVSEDILKKCGGVPLAIITIASLLASNHQIKTKDQWYALLSSFGRHLTEDPSVDDMKKILLFSYYDLPSYLKPCLLYLCMFPEDHKIMRHKLIWMWISEGFVYSENQETSLYDLGDSYFSELLNRSMIQPMCNDDEEKVEACHIHDMVLDLICSISSEEKFVSILDGSKRKMSNSQSKARRLSVQSSKVDVTTTSMAQVRSLTVFTDDIDKMQLVWSSKVLRVLDLEGCTIPDIGSMANLLHLRYLGLGYTYVTAKQLPLEIGKLQFLQTLDLRENRSIDELPSSIIWLRNLVCLYIHEYMALPSGMDNLTSLEVLHGVSVGLSGGSFNLDIVKELGHLTKLRVLEFFWNCLGESMSTSLVKSLGNLHRLEILNITAEPEPVDPLREGWAPPPQLHQLYFQSRTSYFLTLPAWINPSSLPLISTLIMAVDTPRPEDIRLLGMLPALRYLVVKANILSLSSRDCRVKMLPVTAKAFPRAISLYFPGFPVLPSTFPRGAAPMLQSLQFAFPAAWLARGDMDLGMRHLPSLKIVEVFILCKRASHSEVVDAVAALRAAAEDHPNRPNFYIHIDD